MFIGTPSWKNSRLGLLKSKPNLPLLFGRELMVTNPMAGNFDFRPQGIRSTNCELLVVTAVQLGDDGLPDDGVLLGEQAASKPAQQGSNPCAVAVRFRGSSWKRLTQLLDEMFSECAG